MSDGLAEAAEKEVNAETVRAILTAMCRKQGISLVSPFNPDEEARNYTLAQRLGMPDEEEHTTQVTFAGGPWNGQTYGVERVVGPVFAVGHVIGNHYWLDSKGRGTPTYHWDGTEWEIAPTDSEGER